MQPALSLLVDQTAREIWVYKAGVITILERAGGIHGQRPDGSAVLPTCDLQELASFLKPGVSQTAQVRAYRETLRRRA